MYTQHFHLKEPPFSIAPNPRYLYLSPQHREALAHLLYGIGVGGGFVVLTGEVGTGKTTLCRCLLEQLPEDVELALIFNPRLNSRELLASICDELRIACLGKASLKQLIDALNRHLLDAHARGRRTVVLIDEAQNLRFDVLEQIRLLTNLETHQAKLLQIILVGQPELNPMLERPQLRQLAQRITARYHLYPLSRREISDYIRHRLAVAGCRERLFTGPAIRTIHGRSGGIPRLINLMADRALLGAYTLGRHRVNWLVARRAARELLPPAARTRGARLAAALAGVLALAAGLVFFHGLPEPLGLALPPSAPSAASPGAGIPPVQAMDGQPGKAGAAPEVSDATVPAAGLAAPLADDPGAAAERESLASPAPAVPFARWIADPALTHQAAFARLFSLWRLDSPEEGQDACILAGRHGLRCLPLHGTWFQLRSLSHPAVLEFVLPDGARRYAVLARLRNGRLELASGNGTAATFELADILPYWKGDSLLLWKPPEGGGQPLAAGSRSETVAWVRERLRVPAPPGQESLFDAALKARVVAFQTERGLVPDGVVGAQTMIYLGMKDGVPSVPGFEAISR